MLGQNETDSEEFGRLAQIEPVLINPTAYYVLERSRGMLFLLDTGATRSILPSGIFKPQKLCNGNPNLRGVTGKRMKIQGKTIINLEFNLPFSFNHEFLVADISGSYGILGGDFFDQHKLQFCAVTLKLTHVSSKSSIDVIKSYGGARAARKVLSELHGYSPKIINNICDSKTMHRVCAAGNESPSETILWDTANAFPGLFKEPSYNSPPKHSFVLDVELDDNCSSIYHKPRRAPTMERKAIKQNFDKLEKQGVVVRSSSNFASPVTAVKKKNGDYRICVDYTRLNKVTKSLNFPLPVISDLQSLLTKEHHWLSTLDLKSAYYSLPMTRRASKRAAIITHEGTFLPLRSPFGLKNSPAKFCELIASVIHGMESFVFAYIDDFIIFSRTLEEHNYHLKALLSRFKDYGFSLNR